MMNDVRFSCDLVIDNDDCRLRVVLGQGSGSIGGGHRSDNTDRVVARKNTRKSVAKETYGANYQHEHCPVVHALGVRRWRSRGGARSQLHRRIPLAREPSKVRLAWVD